MDDSIEIVDELRFDQDVLVIHAELFRANGRSLQSIMGRARAIIVFAPPDTDTLAGFLAAGARGYLRADERLSMLGEIIHLVAAGGARSEPVVMRQLLRQFRQLLRDTTWS